MSKIIVKKYFDAVIDVKNTRDRVIFYIKFNKKG